MKTHVRPWLTSCGLVAGLILSSASLKAFDIPKHVFTFERLSEAQSEGYEESEPLLLLYADPKKKPT